MKTIFKGGYPSPLLNGLKAVNSGSHIEYNDNFYEVMSKSISTHPYNGVSKYLRTSSGGKIEFSCHISKETGEYQYGIAYYRNKEDTNSFRYTRNIPQKYEHLKNELKEVHLTLFKGVWGVDWVQTETTN